MIYSDIANFPCDLCAKRFKRKRDLAVHRRQVHQGIKNIRRDENVSCDVCGKIYRQKTSLAVHMKIHEGENTEIFSDKLYLTRWDFTLL